MPRKNSIVTKLILVITLSSVLIFAVTLGYNYYQSRMILERELENNAHNLVSSLVYRVETELMSVAKVAEGVARSLETSKHSEQELLALLRATVEKNPEMYGSGIAFEPYAFSAESRLYAPYYYREKGNIAFSRLDKSYRYVPYLYWDWYQIPRELGKPEWSEPYFDEGAGNILMATCSVPFYGGDGRHEAASGDCDGGYFPGCADGTHFFRQDTQKWLRRAALPQRNDTCAPLEGHHHERDVL